MRETGGLSESQIKSLRETAAPLRREKHFQFLAKRAVTKYHSLARRPHKLTGLVTVSQMTAILWNSLGTKERLSAIQMEADASGDVLEQYRRNWELGRNGLAFKKVFEDLVVAYFMFPAVSEFFYEIRKEGFIF